MTWTNFFWCVLWSLHYCEKQSIKKAIYERWCVNLGWGEEADPAWRVMDEVGILPFLSLLPSISEVYSISFHWDKERHACILDLYKETRCCCHSCMLAFQKQPLLCSRFREFVPWPTNPMSNSFLSWTVYMKNWRTGHISAHAILKLENEKKERSLKFTQTWWQDTDQKTFRFLNTETALFQLHNHS